MDYRDILGFSKPKKKITKKTKSTVTENLMKEFGDVELGKVYTDKDKPPFQTCLLYTSPSPRDRG